MSAMPRTAFLVLNIAAYQAGWLACVLSAAAGRPGWGVFAAVGLLVLHLVQTDHPGRDLRIAAIFVAIGAAADSALGALDVFRFAAPISPRWLAPPWLLAIWGLFAITMHASLGWLAGRPWLSALLGAAAGPLAYWGGAGLGGMTLAMTPPAALAVLAGVWGVVLPVLVWLAHQHDSPAHAAAAPPAAAARSGWPLQAFLLACALAYAALLGLLWWGGTQDPGFAGFAAIIESYWGWATLLDLYLGFAVIATWIVATSERRAVGLLWAAALLVLGNLVALAFLLQRGSRAGSWRSLLLGRFAGSASPDPFGNSSNPEQKK